MKTSTIPIQAGKWFLIDAEGKSLGRISAQISMLLQGKLSPSYAPHQLCPDQVIVINASKIKFHTTKEHRKTYVRHTGYLGHVKSISFGDLFAKDPVMVVEKAIKGMLADNKLRKEMLKHLHVYADNEHIYEAQKPINFPV
ncbi:50S ribosomal protein L13 [Patescibacteria group bacterium]|nr:50S ribosomal protein L13 [Patescibacteria group bacterium]MBU1123405.1 50S ribosomal protein L13 [Patescibacteria group bacterium]MBU1911435.1 50S ribosomal protein L13 [Patescibacteria group bacterium]